MSSNAPLLVTSALPYANGNIHLGHIVENIQSDIFVRFQRLVGRDVLFICAADTHGTPIELSAKRQGVDPALMVEKYREQHARDFQGFQVSFDTYYSTHSDENRLYAERVYQSLRDGHHVFEKAVEQFFCEVDQRFLPDRFVKGSCPFCGAADQYGDVCESCKKAYAPVDLKSPYCVLCRTTPVRRESTHLFVRLSDFQELLQNFSARLQPEVRNYVARWLEEGLKDWGISRDGPYFGFPIPNTANKFFYVWLDAPIGYISSLVHYCRSKGIDPARYWPGVGDKPVQEGDESEIWHFIGKDIIYFHTLFWPAMLKAAGFALPSRINAHGMLNLGGAKMSKSRGRMISARDWLDALDPAYLRYYLAANLGPALDDIEFSLDELRNRANSHLVNNVGNLVNRALSFVATRLESRLSRPAPLAEEQAAKLAAFANAARAGFAELNYREAVRQIEALASWANEYMQSAAPWKTIKTEPARAQADVTLVANVIKALATMLSPIVPEFSKQIFVQLGLAPQSWDEGVAFNLVDHTIGVPKPLLPPLDAEQLDKLFASQEPAVSDSSIAVPVPVPPAAEAPPAPPAAFEPIATEIAFDDFVKVDLRVGRVLTAEKIPKAKKILKLSVDVGEPEPRTILAGIALACEPDELVGRRVVVVANLAPREMFGSSSRGMLLAASGGPKGLILADVPGDSAPGTRVK